MSRSPDVDFADRNKESWKFKAYLDIPHNKIVLDALLPTSSSCFHSKNLFRQQEEIFQAELREEHFSITRFN